jgi:hypothetical protein
MTVNPDRVALYVILVLVVLLFVDALDPFLRGL